MSVSERSRRRRGPQRRVSRRCRRGVLTLAVLAVTGASALAISRSPAQRRQLLDSVTRRPTAFTELYFTHPEALPKGLSLSSPNRFDFTIANHEGHAVPYPYAVLTQSSEGTAIERGSVLVRSDKAIDQKVEITARRPDTSYVITIALDGRRERIHFTGVTVSP